MDILRKLTFLIIVIFLLFGVSYSAKPTKTTTSSTSVKTSWSSETSVGVAVGNGGQCGSKNGNYCYDGYCCNNGTCHKQNDNNGKCEIKNGCEPAFGIVKDMVIVTVK